MEMSRHPDRCAEPLQVGILGAGAVVQIVHLPILSERDDVQVRYLADPDRHRAEAVAGRYEVPFTADDSEVLEDGEVDAVFVCAPNFRHEALTIEALQAGKHVLVERPLALDPGGVERILGAAEKAGRTVMVGMNHRFRPDVAALTSFVQSGEIGRALSVRASWLNRYLPTARSTWRHRAMEAGGGALMDLGVPADRSVSRSVGISGTQANLSAYHAW